jgi:hypothetical protein
VQVLTFPAAYCNDHSNDVAGSLRAVGAKLTRKKFEKELRGLQTELCRVQDWVKATGGANLRWLVDCFA